MDNIGKLYKEVRKSRGITLSEATGGEFSLSMLSRFENGQAEMSVQKLLKCLDNIYLDIDEFNLLIREFEPSDFTKLQQEIHHLFNPFDQTSLESLAQEELDKIKLDKRKQFHKLNHILIKARIKSANPDYFISEELIDYLKAYLFSMDRWGNYELILFSEVVHLFESDAYLNYCKEMLNRSDFYKSLPYYSNLIQTILINGIFNCVESNRLNDALQLITIMEKEFSATRDAYMKIVFIIAKGYYVSKKNKTKGKAMVRKGINIYRTLGYENIADYYQNEFQSFLDQ